MKGGTIPVSQQTLKIPVPIRGRRGNNEGSIYQRSSDGRWVGSVTNGYKEDGSVIRKTVYGSSRIEVARKMADLTNSVFISGYVTETGEVGTVSGVGHEWLFGFKMGTIKSRSFEWYVNLFRAHIVRFLGNVPLDKLTTIQVQQMLNNLLRREGKSLRTVKAVRFVLDQLMRHAIDMNIVKDNPVSKTMLMKSDRKISDDNDKALAPEHRRLVLAKADEDGLLQKTVIIIMMFAGLRSGEVLGLQWKHVDLAKSLLTVECAVTYESEFDYDGNRLSRESVLDVTKTVCSVRRFTAPAIVSDCLRKWQKELAAKELSLKKPLTEPSCYVFPNHRGEMRSYSSLRHLFTRFVERHHLEECKLKPHSLRHTCATMMLEAGVNPRVVQEILGHRDVETTLGTYSHVLQEVFDGAAASLDDVYAGLMGAEDEKM